MRAGGGDAGQRLLGRARLAHDLDVVLGRQQRGDAAPDHLVVVHEKNPDNFLFIGRWTCHDTNPLVSNCPLFDANRAANAPKAPRSPMVGTKVPNADGGPGRGMLIP
ncbi:hypothetical protein Arub01_31330 [Actinomadura rubrobrunea]|uniref:Uncharacterized protein n=1 Tax=Actinomadura rubrobrunea TaxID=115335 RepID=A0A9W6PUT0_9ACTN|nr:hypothetical protein Arub01_31330 [Actinomadura rubrobrunea]